MRKRLAHETLGFLRHASSAGASWEFQPGDRVLADGLPGVVASVDDTNPVGIESYQVTLDNGLGGGEYTAAQLSRPGSATAALVDSQVASDALSPVEATSQLTAAFYYPELGTILEDRPPNERIQRTAGLQHTAVYDPVAEETVQEPPSVCSFCGNPGPWTDEQDTGRGTRVRCATCGGTMRLNADEEAGITGIQWQPEFPNSPENAASRAGDPRATINDFRIVSELTFPDGPHVHYLRFGDWPEDERSHSPAGGYKEEGVSVYDTHRGHPVVPGDEIGYGEYGNDTHDELQGRINQYHRGNVPAHVVKGDMVGIGYDGEPLLRNIQRVTTFNPEQHRLHPVWKERVEKDDDGEGLGKMSRLNAAATQEAGYAIFTAPELKAYLDQQLQVTAASLNEVADEDFVFHFTASWVDVRKKATRIRQDGGVRILAANASQVVGEVQGDTAVYESALNYVPGTRKIADWACGCKWGAYAWGRSPAYKRFEGRQCSHVLALQYEAQARGMFGREVTPDRDRLEGQYQRSPVQVQYERPSDRFPEGRDLRRRTVPPGNMRRTFSSKLAYQYEDVPPSYDWARIFTALGTPPSEVLHAMKALGVPHRAARAAVEHATKSAASAAVATEDGQTHLAVAVENGLVHTASGVQLPADAVRLVLAKDKNKNGVPDEQEATADPDGGQGEPGTDIPRIDQRDQSDKKKDPRHLRHHTNDGRKHAPIWGYGVPWGGNYMWCDQCNGSGCGHCGGTGQVLAPQVGSPGPSEASTTNSPMDSEGPDAGSMIGSGGMGATGSLHTADYTSGDFGSYNVSTPAQQVTPHAYSPNPASTGWASSADPAGWERPVVNSSFMHWESMLHHGFVMTAAGDTSKPPTHAGIALQAGDTGRVLMIQRSHKDKKDPAAGTWEFPGGGREDGDLTSLHTGIREWEEEVGQPFPEGGHVSHVHRSGNYVLHKVVIPEESAVDFSNGRATVNPDDPDGDDHEQSAWWKIEHAKKNPALRKEVKSTPWDALQKVAARDDWVTDQQKKYWDAGYQHGTQGLHGLYDRGKEDQVMHDMPPSHLRAPYQEGHEEAIRNLKPEPEALSHRFMQPAQAGHCATCGYPSHEISDLTGQCPRCDALQNVGRSPNRPEPYGGDYQRNSGPQIARGEHEDFSLRGYRPEEHVMHSLSSYLTLDEVRARAAEEVARTGKSAEQLLREGPSLQHDLDLIFQGTLHDESVHMPPRHATDNIADGLLPNTEALGHDPLGFASSASTSDLSYGIGRESSMGVVSSQVGGSDSSMSTFPVPDVLGVGTEEPVSRVLASADITSVSNVQDARVAHQMGVAPAVGVDHARASSFGVGAVPELSVAAQAQAGRPRMAGVSPTRPIYLGFVPVQGGLDPRLTLHGYQNTALLHDEPEPALPSTDGAADDADNESENASDLDSAPDNASQLAVPGLPVDRAAPWGYPESAADHPNPAVAQPGSADLDMEGPENDDQSALESVIAGFQQTAGYKALLADAGPEGGGGDAPTDADIAAAARAMLQKTSMKDFSFAEQQALIAEGGGKVRARNFADLKVEGTHYALLNEDEAPELDVWALL
jgi:8-oxo-dGTP pyrophosphatase MutT (NUDIX family)